MKVLTANRLSDGEAIWFAGERGWSRRIEDAQAANDADGEARLAAIGADASARNEVIDVNLIDVTLAEGRLAAVKLREKIRAAGPTINYAGKVA